MITTRATTTIIVIINIKNEMTRKISVEIKRFMKEYVVQSLYMQLF